MHRNIFGAVAVNAFRRRMTLLLRAGSDADEVRLYLPDRLPLFETEGKLIEVEANELAQEGVAKRAVQHRRELANIAAGRAIDVRALEIIDMRQGRQLAARRQEAESSITPKSILAAAGQVFVAGQVSIVNREAQPRLPQVVVNINLPGAQEAVTLLSQFSPYKTLSPDARHDEFTALPTA